MTRIFDALRKAQATREPAAVAAMPHPIPAPPVPLPGRPTVSRSEAGPAPRPLVLPPSMSGPLPADVIREMTMLRVSLESALAERVPRVVMLESSQGGEGTSTVALQFALTLAQDSRIRTLIVDLHARRPAHPTTPPAAASGEATIVAHLDVLPLADSYRTTGVIRPAEARAAIEANGGGYDWLVLDGPPVLEAPDAATLAAIADGVLVVVQANRTKRPVLTRAADLLRKAGARVLGSVLNRRRLEIPEFIYRRI